MKDKRDGVDDMVRRKGEYWQRSQEENCDCHHGGMSAVWFKPTGSQAHGKG